MHFVCLWKKLKQMDIISFLYKFMTLITYYNDIIIIPSYYIINCNFCSQEIHKKIMSLNFRDCHAKIRQVDSQSTVANAVVVQVSK